MRIIEPNNFTAVFVFNMRRSGPDAPVERDALRVTNCGPGVVSIEARRGKAITQVQIPERETAKAVALAILDEAGFECDGLADVFANLTLKAAP